MKMKFVCINVFVGGEFMDNLLDFIRKEDPDMLALQEVYDGHEPSWERKYRSIEVFTEELKSLPYKNFAPSFLEVFSFGKIDHGNMIMSKHPITNSSVYFYDKPFGERIWDVKDEAERRIRNITCPRNLQEVTIDVNGKNVSVFNTQGVWGMNGLDNEARLHMAEVIAEKVSKKDTAILCGDFNFQLKGTNSLDIIEQKGGVKYIFKDELTTTFNMRVKDGATTTYGTAIVDGIFVTPNIKVLEKTCQDVDVSDHLPLTATLEI